MNNTSKNKEKERRDQTRKKRKRERHRQIERQNRTGTAAILNQPYQEPSLSTSPFSYVWSGGEGSRSCGRVFLLTLFVNFCMRGALSSVLPSLCYPDANQG